MRKSVERYDDYKSTAFLFVPFGILGLAYTFVDYFDIWKRANFINSMFQFIVASAMFIIFIIIGVCSYITASSILECIPQEQDMTEKINSFLKDNLTKEYIDNCIEESEDSPENDAELYYVIIEAITKDIKAAFPEAEDEFVADLVENYYNETF